jgi:hypothetical protein
VLNTKCEDVNFPEVADIMHSPLLYEAISSVPDNDRKFSIMIQLMKWIFAGILYLIVTGMKQISIVLKKWMKRA